MFERMNKVTLVAIGLGGMLVSTSVTHAQCSGGRGGEPAVRSAASFSPSVSSSSPTALAYVSSQMLQRQQMYALQQQLMQQRMQMAALQQQLSQQNAEQRYAQQQKQAAQQRELSDQQRAEQDERVAALKAARTAKIEAKKLAAIEKRSSGQFVSTLASNP